MTVFRKVSSFASNQSGAAAVEFAFVGGLFLLLLAGTMETGRLFWTQHVLNEAAIAGARCMGIRAPDCAVDGEPDLAIAELYVKQEARAFAVAISLDDINLDADSGCPASGGFSKVRISHEFMSVVPFLSETELVAEACFPNQ